MSSLLLYFKVEDFLGDKQPRIELSPNVIFTLTPSGLYYLNTNTFTHIDEVDEWTRYYYHEHPSSDIPFPSPHLIQILDTDIPISEEGEPLIPDFQPCTYYYSYEYKEYQPLLF